VLLSIPKQDSTWFNERHHLSVFWFLELLNKKAPLLRCSCRIGWKRWSVFMISSMSIAFGIIACSVSKGGYTGQHESYNKSATKKNSFDLQSRKEVVIVVIVQNVRPGRRTLRTLALIANFTRFFEQASRSTSTVGSQIWGKMTWSQVAMRSCIMQIPLQDFTNRQFNGPNTPPFSALRDQHARSPRRKKHTWYTALCRHKWDIILRAIWNTWYEACQLLCTERAPHGSSKPEWSSLPQTTAGRLNSS